MPDITMCTNMSCIGRKYCYRATAVPSDRQSMAKFTPDIDKEGNFSCKYLWPIGTPKNV